MKERRQKAILATLLVVWAVVAVWAWSAFQHDAPIATAPPTETSEVAFFIEESGPLDLQLAWLDREQQVGPPTRDLFSKAPIAPPTATETTTQAPDAATVQTVQQPPVIGAALRYMGYVETARGTLALLTEGSQMYLAAVGNRFGAGYRVAMVDEMFVEIEFRGSRRRLPVSQREGDSNGQLR